MTNFEYRQSRPYFINKSNLVKYQDWSEYVSYLHISKTLNANAGTWEVQLTPLSEYGATAQITKEDFESAVFKMFRPMDVCCVGMNGTIMMGLVDNVFQTKSQSNNNVGRSISIRGRDMTKTFIEDTIINAPELGAQENVQEVIGEANTQFISWIRGLLNDGRYVFSNTEIIVPIWWILKNTPCMNMIIDSYKGSQNVKASDLFMTNLVSKKTDIIAQEVMSKYAGRLINYIVQVTDEPFYETWVDTVSARYQDQNSKEKDDKPILIVRPKPFDRKYEIDSRGNKVVIENDSVTLDDGAIKNSLEQDQLYFLKYQGQEIDTTSITWDTLTCPIRKKVETIHSHEITRKDLGVSDYDVFTIFKVIAKNDPLAADDQGDFGEYFPLLDGNMVLEYGVRELKVESNVIPQPPNIKFAPELSSDANNAKSNFRDTLTQLGITPSSVIDDLNDFVKVKKLGFGIPYQDIDDVHNLNQKVQFFLCAKRDAIWRWNRYNHVYQSGTITCSGRDVRVGSKVILPDEQTRGLPGSTQPRTSFEYYCTKVEHTYSFGQNWLTTLGLTRGHNPEELLEYHNFRGFNQAAGSSNKVFVSQFG